MSIWEAILLGLVQGITEFLPVSSSGHLVLIEQILGIESGNLLFFNVMLHLGTLIAVASVLYKDIWALLYPKPSKNILYLIIASIPAALVGFLLNDYIEGFFSSGKFLCFFFLLTAIILLLTDIIGKRINSNKEIGYKSSILMGLAQGIAVLPGISRSGSTIAAGVFSGVEKEKVAKFSFLMSIPVILGSTVTEAIRIDTISIGAWQIVCGMLAAAISGFIAVRFMMRIIKKGNYKWFSLYLLLLSVLTFVNYFIVTIW